MKIKNIDNTPKLIDNVFNDIVNTKEYQKFLDLDTVFGINESTELHKCKTMYSLMINNGKTELDLIAKIEETIIQLRCREMVKREIKLSQVRDYVYARAPFFRNRKNNNDIRVVVGKIEILGNDFDALLNNPLFVNEAKNKLTDAMDKIINPNMEIINNNTHRITQSNFVNP